MHLVFAACGVILAVLLVVGSDEVIKLHRIRIADYIGRGGLLAGVIGVLLKLFSVPLQNIVRLPESLTFWMLVILILSSTAIMMLSKIHEALIAQYNKDYTQELRYIISELERHSHKPDAPELNDILQVLVSIHNKIDSPKFDRALKGLDNLNR